VIKWDSGAETLSEKEYEYYSFANGVSESKGWFKESEGPEWGLDSDGNWVKYFEFTPESQTLTENEDGSVTITSSNDLYKFKVAVSVQDVSGKPMTAFSGNITQNWLKDQDPVFPEGSSVNTWSYEVLQDEFLLWDDNNVPPRPYRISGVGDVADMPAAFAKGTEDYYWLDSNLTMQFDASENAVYLYEPEWNGEIDVMNPMGVGTYAFETHNTRNMLFLHIPPALRTRGDMDEQLFFANYEDPDTNESYVTIGDYAKAGSLEVDDGLSLNKTAFDALLEQLITPAEPLAEEFSSIGDGSVSMWVWRISDHSLEVTFTKHRDAMGEKFSFSAVDAVNSNNIAVGYIDPAGYIVSDSYVVELTDSGLVPIQVTGGELYTNGVREIILFVTSVDSESFSVNGEALMLDSEGGVLMKSGFYFVPIR
jgi:hypothetical protein